jgi:DNA end-binding protein Ku
MARYLWKGSLSFGLVEIPVGLLSAESPDSLHFTFLDRRDYSPVGYQRYNKKTDKPVAWEDIVRGYEYDTGEYVIMSDDDLKRANPEATRSIEIVSFVDAEELEPIYFETPYYVVPLQKASKAYGLMRDTLKRTGKVGIARYVMKTRQHVAALMVREGVLLLQNLRYAHEIVPVKKLDLDAADLGRSVSEKEIKVAEQLVKGMSGKFEPKEFTDTYYDDLMTLIEKRAKAGQTESVEAPVEEKPIRGTRVVDLLPLLERSLATRGKKKVAPAPREVAAAPKRTAKRRPSRTVASRRTKRA